ncbi:YfiR family protein [Curvibacter gracilis]|uniref:YfiR family protein n=1 Tax=Curvibacter gracilis TaxID=230310 RepID=UPI0009FF663A|nr:YfiR family protein [Curvibacter gracilis]
MLTRLRLPTWRSATLAMALSACATLAPAQGSADASAVGPGNLNSRSPALPELLLGILHYTRWPQPLASHRLCLNDGDTDAVALARELDAQGAQAVPPVHSTLRSLRADLADSLLDCQAIYFGAMPVRGLQPLLLRLNRHPILTLGQGDDFCSYGGKFCLLQGPQGWQIKANLDAIAYSGLRVNARLLQLTVRPSGGRP